MLFLVFWKVCRGFREDLATVPEPFFWGLATSQGVSVQLVDLRRCQGLLVV